MNKNSKELLTAQPLQILIKLSLPAILGMIVIGLYPLMDGIFAGQILSERAMTAVGIATPFTYINTGIATLIGVGSASLLSRAIGEGNQRTIDKVMGNLCFWILLLSAIVTVLGILFCQQLLAVFGAKGELLNLSARYLRIIFLGSVFVNFAQAANMVMRGEGLMKRAMLIMAMGAGINISLDPILMILLKEHGVEGAAIATVTAQFVQAIVTLWYFKKKSEVVKIGLIRRENEITGEMFSVGVSAMLMQVLTIIQQSFLYGQAFRYGGETSATIMAATLRIQAFSFIPLWGMSQGLQPAIGANFGAKQYDRVKKIFNVFTISSIVLAACFWLPAEAFAKPVLKLFGLSDETLLLAVPSFRTMYSIFIVYGVMIMTMTFFQAIGDGKTAGILVMLRQIILFIPSVILLPLIVGTQSLWYVLPIVDGIVVLLGIQRYFATIGKMK
ncbi:MATE efflux family protein [Oribacterium sp. oral taxon 078 str. F0263]|uniref:MATE family efflux transporter n=1 Tax=Oribacterium sp. oral taxon 078 TaxID=652706 RepID=UPI0003ADE9DD|nr:MATE family efflux transporter [Oribacterium sp. oral taxon 078]ERL22847.1 MATE efflux family protein [Oribacterium sp. oral taxon 078 str. F0263]